MVGREGGCEVLITTIIASIIPGVVAVASAAQRLDTPIKLKRGGRMRSSTKYGLPGLLMTTMHWWRRKSGLVDDARSGGEEMYSSSAVGSASMFFWVRRRAATRAICESRER